MPSQSTEPSGCTTASEFRFIVPVHKVSTICFDA
jgi:hypothetical protein